MEKIDIVIIGAGVVGLSVALELSKEYKDVFLLERYPSFGQETSSRNSEVIHAGIYYPKDSLKAKTCVEGSRLLYEFCSKNNIPHKKTGKFIVAVDNNEIKDLEEIFANGIKCGVGDLKMLSGGEIKKTEPNIKAVAAAYSPSTGILDSHAFMKKMAAQFTSRGRAAYNTEVVGIKRSRDGFEISIKDADGSSFGFLARVVINSAGLCSDKVAAMAGIKKDEYRIKYCKGDYFRAAPGKARLVSRLVYPVPKKDRAVLGVHATPDMAGGLRFGPDDEYVDTLDYGIDPSKRKDFYNSVSKILPFIEEGDLTPDTSGIRPRLQGPGEGFRDFIIRNEGKDGLPGLVNLVGIESPGLTSSLAIAKLVKKIVRPLI